MCSNVPTQGPAKAIPAPITVPDVLARKGSSRGISALTAYDYTLARLLDAAGVDIILVGDSAACVIQGHSTTLPITLDEIVYHCRCVTRGARRSLVVGDLPFLSYQASIEQGVLSAGRLVKEGGVAAVKLEGGLAMAPLVRKLTDIDIPVMGHVGLTPQSFHRMGGHKIQGKHRAEGTQLKAGSRERILADAVALEEAGAFAIVLEGIPSTLAKEITAKVRVPTIGIGAGRECDGQILVSYDLLGLTVDNRPTFAKQYAQIGAQVTAAVMRFVEDVQQGGSASESVGSSLQIASLSKAGNRRLS